MSNVVPLRESGSVTKPSLLPTLRHRRVLVVEDEYIVAQDLKQELEDMGAEVLGPVPSVADALELLAYEAEPDAALLDVNLGGETVYPVADVLREWSIPFMFVTGYDRGSLPPAYAEVPLCEKPFEAGQCLKLLLA